MNTAITGNVNDLLRIIVTAELCISRELASAYKRVWRD